MEGLVVGIDLCDTYTQVNCADEEMAWTVPTVICKSKHSEEWYVGEDAYAHVLLGDGIIVDQLVNMAMREGTATIGDVRYEGRQLLKRFLEQVLEFPQQEYGMLAVRQLVVTVEKLEQRLMEVIYACAEELDIKREQVHIISHAEGFTYYILNQKREIWNGAVGMFDLSEQRLRYFEMKAQRGMKKTTVLTEYENLEEAFSLDILETPSGGKLADKILCSCGERMMQKKLYSAVFLTGKGFLNREWAEAFMKLICTKRRVYMESAVFAKGAAYRAEDFLREKTTYPYICICEGHLRSTISMNVLHKGQETSVVLASAGDNWYDVGATVDVIPEKQETIDFIVTSADSKQSKVVSVALEGFPKRPERTTKVRIQVSFLDERTMDIKIKDQGFGELFPASGVQIRQEVMI